MSFFRFNIYKVLAIYFGIAILLAFLFGAATSTHALRFTIGFSGFITAFITLIGLYNFNIRERLLFGTPDNSILDVFDNGLYTVRLKWKSHLFLFVRKELLGTIAGYPVAVILDPRKDGSFDIQFSVSKTQGIYAGHVRTQILVIPWDWRRRLEADIKDEVSKFVEHLHKQHDEIPGAYSEEIA